MNRVAPATERPVAGPEPSSPAGRSLHFSSWERWLLERALHRLGSPPISVSLGPDRVDGRPLSPSIGNLVVHDHATLWRLGVDPEFEFGEAYADGRLDVDGDMVELLTATFHAYDAPSTGARVSRYRERGAWWRGDSASTARDHVASHYDIGNDFYHLWLDPELIYTCAYYARPELTLEEAQRAKLDLVCRKLRLKPGQTVVEAGCGWGALALHMARVYGVRVRAYNIAREQVEWARESAQRAGVADRVQFIEGDWREIDSTCDVFVSVGMLEHVGPRNYKRLGEQIARCLRPGGTGLIHTIGRNFPRPLARWIRRRVFPGAYLPTLRQMMDIFEPRNFTVVDVENLRPHYAQTLRHWLERFEASVDRVREMFDERFVRIWRLYLAGSIAAFAAGTQQLFQVMFARSPGDDLPWTREDIYHDAG